MDRTKRFEGKVAFITGTGGGLGNSTIAIFYAKADDPDMGQLGMRVIPILPTWELSTKWRADWNLHLTILNKTTL